MLALIYLIVLFLLGDSICRRFIPFLSVPHRLAVSFISGLLISSWGSYLAAYLFSGTSRPMMLGNLLFFITAIGAIAYLRQLPLERRPSTEIDPETTKFKKWDWVASSIFFIFGTYLLFGTLTMGNGSLWVGHHQSSDFGSTVSIMQTFAQGHNFPTEYPHFSGDRIRYHFLFYFQAGNLEYLGLSPALANNVLSILSLMSMLVLVMTLGAVMFASRLVGRIGAALFFFHGSLAFIPFFIANGSLSAVLTAISTRRDFLSSGLPYRGEDWGVWSQVVYLNQRHLASSISIFLIVLIFLAIRHRERVEMVAANASIENSPVGAIETGSEETARETESEENPEILEPDTEAAESENIAETASFEVEVGDENKSDSEGNDFGVGEDDAEDERESEDLEAGDPTDEAEPEPREPWTERFAPFVFCGLLLGLMPMWNGAVFAGAASVLALMLLLLPFRREMMALAAASAVIALPQVLFLKTGLLRVPEYSLFHCCYTIDDPTLYKVFYYLIFTFGFKWILIGIAIAFGSRLQRLMILAFTALILIAINFQFSEEVLANHKFFNVWLVLINIPVAFGMVKLWGIFPGAGAVFGRALAITLAILITIGGIIDIFPIRNSFWAEYKYDGDPLVEWVKTNTDPKSIFLSPRYVNHGILLAGRRLFYGHPYYAWGAGYPTSERDIIYKRMYESKDINEVFRLLKENRISYVVIDNSLKRPDLIRNPNDKLMEAYFQTVFTDAENKYDNIKILAVPEVLGPPNPNILLPEAPSPTPAEDPTQTAFKGGAGNAPGQFSRPRGITSDRKGNFFVADTGNGRVQQFASDGKFIASFGKQGSNEGELGEPNGIAIDTTGNIFVTDALNHKLVKLGPDGKFIKEWKGPDPGFYGPRDIAFGPNKNLYIVDQGRTRIVRFDPSTEAFTSWGTSGAGEGQFLESTGITIGNDLVFVADLGNNRIQVFDLDGKFIRMWEVPPWERYVWHYPDLAIDEQAKLLYVTNGWKKEILVYDVNGMPIQSDVKPDGHGEFENPSGICFLEANKKKRILTVNTGSSNVSEIGFDIKTTK